MALAVVTGSSSGIGQALAIRLSRSGHHVLAVARCESKLLLTKSLGKSDNIIVVVADITASEGREAVLRAVAASGQPVRYLVQNAGMIGPISPGYSRKGISEDQWRATFELNVHAPLFLVQELFKAGAFNGTGEDGTRILHMGSNAAHKDIDGFSAYCSSKAAFFMLSRCLNAEFTREGQSVNVCVSSVQPGIVESPMQETIRGATEENMKGVRYFRMLKENEYQSEDDRPHKPPLDGLDTPENAAFFCEFLLTKISREEFVEKEHDIRDSSHWNRWTKDK